MRAYVMGLALLLVLGSLNAQIKAGLGDSFPIKPSGPPYQVVDAQTALLSDGSELDGSIIRLLTPLDANGVICADQLIECNLTIELTPSNNHIPDMKSFSGATAIKGADNSLVMVSSGAVDEPVATDSAKFESLSVARMDGLPFGGVFSQNVPYNLTFTYRKTNPFSSSDLIPIINGVEMSNWAWWNTTYNKRIIVGINNSFVNAPINYTYFITINSTYNLTGLTNGQDFAITWTNMATGTETEAGFYRWNLTQIGGWTNPTKAPYVNWSFVNSNGTIAVFIPTAPANGTQNITIYYNASGAVPDKSYLQNAFFLADDFNAVGYNSTKWINSSSVYWNQDGSGFIKVSAGGYPNTLWATGINASNVEAWYGLQAESNSAPYSQFFARAQTTTRTGSAWKGYGLGMIEGSAPDRGQGVIGGEGITETYSQNLQNCIYSSTPREIYALVNGSSLAVNLLDTPANNCSLQQNGTATGLGGGYIGIGHGFGGFSWFDFLVVRNFLNGTSNITALKSESQGTSTIATAYDSPEYDINSYIHQANVTIDPSVISNVSAVFSVDGTTYPMIRANDTTKFYFNATFQPPLQILPNITRNATWTFTFNLTAGGTSQSTSTYSFLTYGSGLVICNSTWTNTTLNYSFFDGATLAPINVTMTNIYTITLPTGQKSVTLTNSSNTTAICKIPANQTFGFTSQETYNSTGYTPITIYRSATAGNSITYYNIYLDFANATQPVTITIVDNNFFPLAGYYVNISKRNPTNNQLINVGQGQTNSLGQYIQNLIWVSVPYTFQVYDTNGNPQTNVTDIAVCTSVSAGQACTLTLKVGNNAPFSYYNTYASTSSLCGFNNGSYVLSCAYNDTGNSMSSISLSLKNLSNYANAQITSNLTNNTLGGAFSGNISVVVPNATGSYYYVLMANYYNASAQQNYSVQLDANYVYINQIKNRYATDGWFLAFILVISMAFIGFSIGPSAGLAMLAIGLTISALLELITLNVISLVSADFLIAIFIMRLSQTGRE